VAYPFAALVGQDQLKTALLLNAVNPAIGGVLIRGEKGTAKSTAARALAALLPSIRVVAGCPFQCDPDEPGSGCPHCEAMSEHPGRDTTAPFVDLPLGATEDRVLGTLDFESALREGRRSFQPGLLAGAHRGILYIDEVNLLPDHLVDVLLDAAALGINTVQREGVSVVHPARFILVGTMNPEEGDLRPQLLDRFGLVVEVAGSRDPEQRAEVVRRRITFETDPTGFAERWATEQAGLRECIRAARALLPHVVVGDGLITLITRLCCELEVDGLRADIGLYKTARTLAAWDGRKEASVADVRRAAEMVLPHRRRRKPFEQPGLERDRLDDFFSGTDGQKPSSLEGEKSSEAASGTSPEPREGQLGANDRDGPSSSGEMKTFEPAAPQAVRRIEVAPDEKQIANPRGRRNSAPTSGRGQYVRALADEAPTDLALDATVRAAARRGARIEDGRLEIQRSDLHRKERTGKTGTLILFLVDASGSMGARRRMEAVKTAVLSLLKDAYEQRDQVGVIAFRGPEAELLLPPCASVELAERALRILPTGGRTPLAHALVLARETVSRARRSHPDLLVLLVILSDGKANVGLPSTTGDPVVQALQAAEELAGDGVPALVLDSDAGYLRMGRARELAEALRGEHLVLEGLSAEEMFLKVRQRRSHIGSGAAPR
jgi:magnesium chelatase subunit D